MSRRAGVRRIMHRDPDYSVSAKITTPHGGVVADVPCRIYLPRTMSGRPYIELDLSEAQEGPLTVPEFSVQGHAEIPIGVISVRSDIVLTQSWSEERQGSKFIKCTLPGEPWDLEIITARKCENNDEMIKNGIFWLTPNKLLTPFVMPIFSQTGEVKIQSARELDFELPTAALRFRKYFLHEQKRIGVLTTSQLIAEFEGNIVREHCRSWMISCC